MQILRYFIFPSFHALKSFLSKKSLLFSSFFLPLSLSFPSSLPLPLRRTQRWLICFLWSQPSFSSSSSSFFILLSLLPPPLLSLPPILFFFSLFLILLFPYFLYIFFIISLFFLYSVNPSLYLNLHFPSHRMLLTSRGEGGREGKEIMKLKKKRKCVFVIKVTFLSLSLSPLFFLFIF